MTKLVFGIVLFAAISAHGECVPRRNETHATLSTAMYHWGKAARLAGTLGYRGLQDSSSITPQLLDEANQAMAIARDCLEAAMNRTATAYHPVRANRFIGEEKAAYLETYYEHLEAYGRAFQEISSALCELNLTAIDPTVLQRLVDADNHQQKATNSAHRSL